MKPGQPSKLTPSKWCQLLRSRADGSVGSPRDELLRNYRAVRAGIASETQYGAVVPPLHLSSNFTFAEIGQPRAYDYTRSANPTRDQLGQALAELEGGAGAVVTGIDDDLIRLSVGIEDGNDLIADLSRALDATLALNRTRSATVAA